MAAWKGALDFRGFPVNVAFHAQKKSTRWPGFKMIGPDGQPPVNKSFDATSGKQISNEQIGRAVSVGKGRAAVLHPLTEAQIEAITAKSKTEVMEAGSFAPVSSLPLELALMAYVVTPDPDVAGADRSAAVLWNGLRATKLAYLAQATIASGDAIVAIWATDTEMKAVTLPFVQELYPKPAYEWKRDKGMADVFAKSLEDAYVVEEFQHELYESQYVARRNAVIEQVLEGKADVPTLVEEEKPSVPDLMDMLVASMKEGATA